MHKCYLYYSYVSVLVCLSASLVFYSLYGNIQGGIWAGAAALIAALCAVLHSLHFSNKLPYYFTAEMMNKLNVMSFIINLIAVAFMIWYAFTMVYWKIPLLDYERTPIFPCVFSFMTGKWGHHLYMTTKEYTGELTSNYSPLIETA